MPSSELHGDGNPLANLSLAPGTLTACEPMWPILSESAHNHYSFRMGSEGDMGAAASDAVELVTFQVKESYVYAPIPPATSYGHRAEFWVRAKGTLLTANLQGTTVDLQQWLQKHWRQLMGVACCCCVGRSQSALGVHMVSHFTQTWVRQRWAPHAAVSRSLQHTQHCAHAASHCAVLRSCCATQRRVCHVLRHVVLCHAVFCVPCCAGCGEVVPGSCAQGGHCGG